METRGTAHSPDAVALLLRNALDRQFPIGISWTALDGSVHRSRGRVRMLADDHVVLDDEEGPLHLDAITRAWVST